MTVKELIEQLQHEDPDRLVVMSRDGEGNGFSPLHSISPYAYQADDWPGKIGMEELTPEARQAGYSEDDIITNGQRALVFWPI